MARGTESEMTRLEELQLLRELKEVVLEYVSTLYSSANIRNHGFDVLICRHKAHTLREREQEIVMIRAIVYMDADRSKFKLLKASSTAHFGIMVALQEFLKELERALGDMTGMAGAV